MGLGYNFVTEITFSLMLANMCDSNARVGEHMVRSTILFRAHVVRRTIKESGFVIWCQPRTVKKKMTRLQCRTVGTSQWW